MNKLLFLISIFSFVSCTFISEQQSGSDKKIEVCTTYFTNGKIKTIESFLGKYRYGHQIEFDSLGNMIYKADFINDTLDGNEYTLSKDDYGKEYFYDMGIKKTLKIMGIFEDTLFACTYYFIHNDTAYPMGDVVFNNYKVIDSLANFHTIDYDSDTIKLGSRFNFLLNLYSLKHYDRYHVKLFQLSKKDSVLIIDTLMQRKGNEICRLSCSAKPLLIGKNKIRGEIIMFPSVQKSGSHKKSIEFRQPVYLNYFVLN